jgi:hypothetical protein
MVSGFYKYVAPLALGGGIDSDVLPSQAAEQRPAAAHSASCGFKVYNGKNSGRSDREIMSPFSFAPSGACGGASG